MPFFLLPFSIHVVKGHSMQPGLKEGDRVTVFRWAYLFSRPKVGDVVVFRGSDGKEYVKRVKAVAKGELIVEGDNKGDSKKLQPIRKNSVIGKVVAKY